MHGSMKEAASPTKRKNVMIGVHSERWKIDPPNPVWQTIITALG
jgi:hypothetical protein